MFLPKSVLLVLWCSVLSLVSAMEKTSMYMKRSEVNDQAMSGSGYSYDLDDAKPQEYSFEVGHNDKALKILKDLGYDPFAESERYAAENLPLSYDVYSKDYLKTATYKPVAFLVNENGYKIPEGKVLTPSLYPNNEYNKFGYYPHAYPYASGYDHASHNKNFLKKGGQLYDDYASAKRGESGDTGYKTVDAFSKGSNGKYDNQDSKFSHNQSGGKKQLVFDNAGNYAVKHASGASSLGGSFGQKDGHNKGSKTTGFHKVYHKDDYNKQHNFYDKADQRGNFNKYGDFDAKHGNSEGSYVKGASENNGYASDKYGASDSSDKGKFDQIAKGFKKADGQEGFYQNYAGFSKKGDKDSGSVHAIYN